MKKIKIKIYPSVMCLDWRRVEKQIKELEDAGVDGLHFDIVDGNFVPNLTLGPDIIKSIRRITRLPFDIHLMVSRPQDWIMDMREAGADIISFHIETSPQIMRIIERIREVGAKPAIALNPATPSQTLDYIVEELSMVLVMAVEPGFAGQKMIPFAIDKIKEVKKKIDEKNPSCELQVDGNVSFQNAPKMVEAGASILVVGTSSIFSGKSSLKKGVEKLRKLLKETYVVSS